MAAVNLNIAWRLEETSLPSVSLPSTDGGEVSLRDLRGHRTVLFTYPKNMVEMPGVTRPENWYELPGCPG